LATDWPQSQTAWRQMKFVFVTIVMLILATPVHARDPKQVAAFRKLKPCPSTKKATGPCPDWVVDHIVPLCWGGDDLPGNMQWQEKRASYLKDKFEREACALKKKAG
jgi:hypothetical protein